MPDIQEWSEMWMWKQMLFTIARIWRKPRYPWEDEWLKKLWYLYTMKYFVVVQSLSVSDSLQPLGMQHSRLPCPSLSPRVCSKPCPLCQWCYCTILSSAALFSFCLLSFIGSGSFQMSQLFTSDDRSFGASAQHQSFQWIFRVDFL